MAFALPGGKSAKTGASKSAEAFGESLEAETRGPRQAMFSQIEEALVTGGVGARIPLIQRAVESSRREGSNAMRQTGDQLALSGLAGTPFGEAIRADVGRSSAFQTSLVPSQIIQDLITQGMGFISGGMQVGSGALGSAASAQAAVRAAQIQAVAGIIQKAQEGLNQAGAAAMGMGGMT